MEVMTAIHAQRVICNMIVVYNDSVLARETAALENRIARGGTAALEGGEPRQSNEPYHSTTLQLL
jgi:hypothetical protein